MFPSYPKIFTLGQKYIMDIFKEDVEVTEKIDGSQFCFGKIDGELQMRSKGAQINIDNPDNMFKLGVEYVKSIEGKLSDNVAYYAEYLQKPKHNVLAYERTPKNNLILFGVMSFPDQTFPYDNVVLDQVAYGFGIEAVPVLYSGKVSQPDELYKLLETDSVLGNHKIEGIVVKNYARPFLLGDRPIPLMAGKYVSDKFKETHEKSWKKENTGKGKWETYQTFFRTDARWEKAIQHLKENGQLDGSPKDIGILLKEIQRDIIKEEQERIKGFLWKQFGKDLLRSSIRGFPEFYKKKLLEDSF